MGGAKNLLIGNVIKVQIPEYSRLAVWRGVTSITLTIVMGTHAVDLLAGFPLIE